MKSSSENKDYFLSELELRDRMIIEETAAKYEAWQRINELQKEIRKLKGESDDE